MNLAVWGTKSEAVYLGEQIEENVLLNLKYFIDNNKKNWGTTILCGGGQKEIHSFSYLVDQYKKDIDAIIIAVRGTHSRLSIIQQLEMAGIEHIGIFKFSAHDFGKKIKMDEKGNSEYIVWLNKSSKPVIPYLETHIMDSCNLNCKGCTHFSNLFDTNSEVIFRKFKEDINRIAQKCDVVQLRLLGGEPLLNTECHTYISCARKALPHADIDVVTNGLLILRQNETLFSIMRANHVGFHISQYLPTTKIKDLIEAKCKEEKVDYFFERDVIAEFAKHLSVRGDNDTEKSQIACVSRGCRFLRNGRLYKCPTEGLIDKFAERYGYNNILDEPKGFDIYDDTVDWKLQLKNYLDLPVPVCKYCAEKREMFKWTIRNQPEADDWLVARPD